MQVKNNETIQEFHMRAMQIEQNLEFANVTMSKTIVVQTYLDQLSSIPSVVTFLADFNRRMRRHLRVNGDNIEFSDSITDIFDYLIDSKVPTLLVKDQAICQPVSQSITPSASYANNRPKLVCKACGRNHDEDDCFRRGLNFLPPSEAKRIMRYNELHRNKPKVPKKDPLPKPSRPFHSKKKSNEKNQKPAANSAEINFEEQEDQSHFEDADMSNQESDAPVETLVDPFDHTPSAQFAEFMYPSANMAQATLPDDAVLEQPQKPTLLTSFETPELSSILSRNDMSNNWTQHLFHVDFGANIIIMNTNEFFYSYKAQQENIEHIAGDTIPGIEGYGTIVIKLNHKLHVIRSVAYMPRNTKCTFSAHHLQRMNKFNSGIHAMHSCIKLIDHEGFQTKVNVKEIRNGLDYIELSLLPKNTAPFHPEACTAIKHQYLTPELIHQKCAHYHYDRIKYLAQHELIEGLPKNLPPMTKPCHICLAMKSRKLPRRKKVDWTEYKPGESIHMDFAFMPVVSIRGFTAFLAMKDAATNYTWVFVTHNKRPPLDIIQFFLLSLKKENRTTRFVRVDEDGALARSTAYCKLLLNNTIKMQTTGGRASSLNGKSESLNKIAKHTVASILASANMDPMFWCFAMVHGNNVIRSLSLNPNKTMTAKEAWTAKKPKWSEFRIPFCDVYVLDETLNIGKAKKHTFLTFGAT
ncbi:MAG: hypothetical protein ACPGED_06935, partial [Flavobacteriales bacterium]